jgi:hypothetical protein
MNQKSVGRRQLGGCVECGKKSMARREICSGDGEGCAGFFLWRMRRSSEKKEEERQRRPGMEGE